MNVRIIRRKIFRDESFGRVVEMLRPVVQVKISGVWVTVKEFLNYFKDEAEEEAKKLYNRLKSK